LRYIPPHRVVLQRREVGLPSPITYRVRQHIGHGATKEALRHALPVDHLAGYRHQECHKVAIAEWIPQIETMCSCECLLASHDVQVVSRRRVPIVLLAVGGCEAVRHVEPRRGSRLRALAKGGRKPRRVPAPRSSRAHGTFHGPKRPTWRKPTDD